MLAICVDPRIIEPAIPVSVSDHIVPQDHHSRWPCRHCRTRLLCATFRYNSVEQVEILVKVKNCLAHENKNRRHRPGIKLTVASDPLHNVHILGQHHDRLEIARHERRVDERTAQVEWLASAGPSVRLYLGRGGLVRRRGKRCRRWRGRTLWPSWSTIHSSESSADRLFSPEIRRVRWPTYPRELKNDIFVRGGVVQVGAIVVVDVDDGSFRC